MKSTIVTKIFSDRLETLVKDTKSKCDCTEEQIAAKIGISKSNLSKYQNDAIEAKINALAKIAQYFGVSTDYLLGLCDYETTEEDIKISCKTTHLSADAIEAIQKLGEMQIRALNIMLTQPEISFWLTEIYRIAAATSTCEHLAEKSEIERVNSDNPRLTTLAESALSHIAIPELENAETQERKRRYALIKATISGICELDEVKLFGTNSVQTCIAVFRNKYNLEE